MDWLVKHKVVLLCEERTVSLETELGRIAKVTCNSSGIHLSSFSHGLEASQEVGTIEVVRYFPDALDEVKGLPLRRKIEFCIDLVTGAIPVVQPNRRMAPRERERNW